MKDSHRNTTQKLLPLHKPDSGKGEYDIYPVHEIGEGKIFSSIELLFSELPGKELILIDGRKNEFTRLRSVELNINVTILSK